MTNRQLDSMLAFHCSPTLAGIKSASLFTVKRKDSDGLLDLLSEYNRQLEQAGVRLEVLCECETHFLVLVYRSSLLWPELKNRRVRRFLEAYGYTDWTDLAAVLNRLKSRCRECCFPHEIGLFLSYPLDDVIGFIEHRGKNCKMCGYWKVYSDEEAARKRFRKYTLCRDDFYRRVQSGISLLALFHAA